MVTTTSWIHFKYLTGFLTLENTTRYSGYQFYYNVPIVFTLRIQQMETEQLTYKTVLNYEMFHSLLFFNWCQILIY